MKRPLKQFYYLFLAFFFAISLIDCMLVDQDLFHEQISSNKECSELPSHLNDSQLNHFDDVPYFDSGIQSVKYMNHCELFSTLSTDLKSNYLNCIWQPPKRA